MVGQDGFFSTYVYPGQCRIVAKDGNGPWENRHDTLIVDVNRNLETDYEVVPYYTISDVNYTVSPDSILTAQFTVTQVSENANIGTMGVLVNKTQFVDLTSNVKSTSSPGQTGKISLSMDIKNALKNERYLFARIFVKNADVDEALYTVDIHQLK